MAQSTVIEDEQIVEAQPAGVNTPDSPAVERTIKAQGDLTKEYVAGQANWRMLHTMVQALSAYIDDITRDFGLDQYDRMMTDSQVSSVVKLLVMAVLAEEVRVAPPVDNKDTRFALADKITKFCGANLEHLDRPIVQILYQMVEGALVNGYKVAEQVYSYRTLTPDTGLMLTLSKLKPKPQTALSFVVDDKGNELGLLNNTPGMPNLLTGTAPLPENQAADGNAGENDTIAPPNLLPREKFAVLSHLARDGDPRGRSILRAVYTPWWVKQQVWPELLAYLARFGSGFLLGNVDPDSVADEDGRTPEQQLTTVLESVRNGAVAGLPPLAKVDLLEATGEGGPFFTALALADTQIAKGVLLQTLTSEEGKHQARAAAQVHQDVFGLLIFFIKGLVISMLELDVLMPLVKYNFGEDAALMLTPRVSLGNVDRQDFATFSKGIAALYTAGAIMDEQLPAIWEMMGLPPVDEEVLKASQQERKQRQQAAQDAAKNAPTQEDNQDGQGDPNNPDDQQQGN